MNNRNEKILEDINNLKGYKVTYIYATAINIKDNNMNPWFEKIESILFNLKGVIRILSPDKKPLNYDYWALPGKYKRYTKEYHKKLEKFLEKFATNVNINKGLFDQNNIHGYKYKKYIFTPYIEITHENTLNLFFLTLTIFNNGTFVIEIVEDLESINFGDDLYSTFSIVEDKIYPLINQENNNRQRQYQLYGHRQYKNIRDVSRQINRIIKNNSNDIFEYKVSRNMGFEVYYLANENEFADDPFYEDVKIQEWLVNAPIISFEGKSKHFRQDGYSDNYINFLNKASVFVVWMDEQEGDILEQCSKMALYFHSSANFFFLETMLNELQLYGYQRYNLNGKKEALYFRQWILNFKRSIAIIYRTELLPSLYLYLYLKNNNDFKSPQDIEELNKEELSLIELEQSYKEEERSENLNKLLLIISLLSIFQVVDIFFNDKNNIFYISLILIMILLVVFRKK
ncbi:TPA: hypothetical protein ACGULK_001356 [Staphylococcus aureus]